MVAIESTIISHRVLMSSVSLVAHLRENGSAFIISNLDMSQLVTVLRVVIGSAASSWALIYRDPSQAFLATCTRLS
jgi:hypothetical protein